MKLTKTERETFYHTDFQKLSVGRYITLYFRDVPGWSAGFRQVELTIDVAPARMSLLAGLQRSLTRVNHPFHKLCQLRLLNRTAKTDVYVVTGVIDIKILYGFIKQQNRLFLSRGWVK